MDQRLIRDEIIGLCGADALALYLFLITVADARGLSYYSDRSIVRRLSFDAGRLFQAWNELLQVGLIPVVTYPDFAALHPGYGLQPRQHYMVSADGACFA